MGNINKNALNSIYQSSKIGLDSIEFLYGKVEDKSLKSDMNEYAKRYYDVLNETIYRLDLLGDKPTDYSPVTKALMWTGIQKDTFANSNPGKIAQLLIEGSTKGIVEMTKNINNENISMDIKKIANTLIEYEKQNINNMKKYL